MESAFLSLVRDGWPYAIAAALLLLTLGLAIRVRGDSRLVWRLENHPDTAVYEQELVRGFRSRARVERLVRRGVLKRTRNRAVTLDSGAWRVVQQRGRFGVAALAFLALGAAALALRFA